MGSQSLNDRYSELKSEIRDADLKGIFALVRALPKFFRGVLEPEQAKELLRRRLERRPHSFVEQVRRLVYDNPTSPYLRLLENAGCELSDLRTEVRLHGVEETLRRLAREGVYLTADEFKGKQPVVRGAASFRVSPRRFECAPSSPGFLGQSSGTSNAPLRTFTPLAWLAARSISTSVFLAAHDLLGGVHAVYDTILPGSAGINQVLTYARAKVIVDRWFARRIPVTLPEALYFNATTYLVLMTARWFGPGAPKLSFVDFEDSGPILEWIGANRLRGRTSCITTAASNAARIARAAAERGVSLEGVKFVASGEPFTRSKQRVIETAGATATVRVTYGGSVNVGFGCAYPAHVDDAHVNQDVLALVSHTRRMRGNVEVEPLLCTTLEPSVPRFLLNVESGDYASLEQRDCGCALGQCGLGLHLHSVRSFEKFTSEGMNYFFADLFEIFERRLPNEFGGGPGDYQMIEEEAEDGRSRLRVLVHPRVSGLDEQGLLRRIVDILTQGTPGNRVTAKLWEMTGTLEIRREPPRASARGKILPLQLPVRDRDSTDT